MKAFENSSVALPMSGQYELLVQDRLPVRPFLRWAGGKARLLPKLLSACPNQFNAYHEPFVGGGAMFFAIAGRRKTAFHLADLNLALVETWQAVRDSPNEFADVLASYHDVDSESFYYETRGVVPQTKLERAAWFFYLNQTSWNALWRVNRKGTFNVPWGARAFRGIERHTLLEVSSLLQDASIEHEDFRTALQRVRRNDFVYLDPPYLPVSETSKFYFYTEKRFRLPDLEELAALTRDLDERGTFWLLSNRDTPTVRELFGHARITPLTTTRSVAAQNAKSVEPKNSPEVIISGVR